MYVVGISAFFHDSAACLLHDGMLVAAAEEERFTGIKHDSAVPKDAMRFCLEKAGVTQAEIDCIAYYEDPRSKLARQLWMGLPGFPLARQQVQLLDPERPTREIRQILGYHGPIEIVPHHLSHAASAFFFSGFDDAAIFVADGVGEWATTSYGRGQGDQISLFEEVRFPDSLGLLYSTMTGYLGFAVNNDEYKVMGLAPYGKPRYVEQMRQLIRSGSAGQFNLVMNYFDFLNPERMYSEELIALFGQPPRAPESEILPFHQDVAHSLQLVVEEILFEKLTYLHGRVPSDHLCLSGGLALNCVANGKIRAQTPFDRVFIQPAAGDAGGAVGAAAIAHRRRADRDIKAQPLHHVFLGPSFSSEEIYRLLCATPLRFDDFRDNEAELLAVTADHLAAGKVVGWFHGAMEFGPRALGGRSILADARVPDMRDRINALVKKREAFRPFAPAVRAEKAALHFAMDEPSPFMLQTFAVRSPLDLPAITHVDGSARVQTVDERHNGRFARLLRLFEERTGSPVLLNTSFNMRGETIVCTPEDALSCFVRAQIDVLVLEDFVVERSGVPGHWKKGLELIQRARRSGAITHRTYTFL
ncbi:MAG: carbamoyltransferase [Proteobacteria bacterium]|nr:carbamoyltransferase [Pseudomonadota bacterium]